jgi:hypothetical protein
MPEISDPLKAALIAAAALIIFVVIAVVSRRAGRRRLAALAPAFELGTTRLVGFSGNAVEGLFQGFTIRYNVETPSQYSPGGVTIRLAATNPVQWSAAVEDFGSRLMARFGIVKDVEIGDDELDGLLRFSSNDEIALIGLFGIDRVRSAMRRLATGENFNSIGVRSDRVDVKWAPRNPVLDDNPDAARERMDQAVELLTAIGSSPSFG